MVNTVNSSATTVAVGTVTEEILMEVDFCRERLRVGRDLWELWLYVGDLVLDFVAMVVVVLVWGLWKGTRRGPLLVCVDESVCLFLWWVH